MKNMTVADIIQKLKQLPQDALVLVDGYEGGLDAVIDTALYDARHKGIVLYEQKRHSLHRRY